MSARKNRTERDLELSVRNTRKAQSEHPGFCMQGNYPIAVVNVPSAWPNSHTKEASHPSIAGSASKSALQRLQSVV